MRYNLTQKKNILFFIPTLQKGGAERVVSLLLKKYNELDNIVLYFITMEKGVDYDLPCGIKHITLYKTNKGSFRKLIELPFVAFQLAQYIKRYNIDVVASFLYRANYVNIISKFFGAKHRVVINIRQTTSRYLYEGILGKVNLFLIRVLFNKADLIISNSKGVDEDLKSLMNIKTNTKVINNPIDIEFINKSKEICMDVEFNFNSEKKYIISVGRLIKQKRNKDLIEAFIKINKSYDNLELIFLGDGNLKEKLIEYCKANNVYEKVHFLGNVSNPFYYLHKSDLFVLTSEFEGFPNVLIEAMACGLPVISSDCKSGPNEILENGKYGFLYPVGNINALIEKIKIVLNGNIDIENIKIRNMERCQKYDINKILNEFTKAFYE